MKALVIVIALGVTLLFAATAQAITVTISLKGVIGPGVSPSTVLIIAEAQNRHVGGNWTVTPVRSWWVLHVAGMADGLPTTK